MLFGVAGLFAAAPETAVLLAGIAAAFVLVAACDALWGLRSMQSVRAMLPDSVRLTRRREGEIRISLMQDEDLRGPVRLRLGLAFPAGLISSCETLAVHLPPQGPSVVALWPCVGERRGKYRIENVYVESASPLGLWAARKTCPGSTEVRVYPNLATEQRHLAGLFLNRGMYGVHARRQVGKGKEFEKLREYVAGDNYEDIHWKSTAKRGHPVTKVFQIERTQEVYVVLDASRLSSRLVSSGNGDVVSQLDRFVTAALVLGLVAEKQGDLFGVIAFDERVRAFVRARGGKGHYGACREALYTLEPALTNPDFGEAFSFMRTRLRRRALLVFLTNLDDPVLSEAFTHHLEVLAPYHLLLVNMLGLPGVAPLFSRADVRETDDLYRRLAGHLQWQKLREVKGTLARRGVSMAIVENEKMCSELVSQYLNVKRRQLL